MKRTTRYILIFTGLVIFGFALWYFKSIVLYIIIAGILSLIGSPLVSLLCKIKIKDWRVPRAMGAGLTLLFLWALIFSFFSIFIPIVAKEAKVLSEIKVESVLENLEVPLQHLDSLFSKSQVTTAGKPFSAKEYAAEKMISFIDISDVSNFLGYFAGTLGDIVISIFSISFITFFFLKDDQLVSNVILTITPSRYSVEIQHIMESVSKLLKRYFIGIGIEVISVSTLITVGLSIVGLRLNHILIIAFFAGMVNVIPYIGPIIGGTFGVVIGIATHLHLDYYSELLPLIGLIALVFITVQIIDNVVFQPLIYSSSVHAHPLEIFLVILIAGNLAGIPGMILAIPTYTIIRVIAKEFFKNSQIVKKLTRDI